MSAENPLHRDHFLARKLPQVERFTAALPLGRDPKIAVVIAALLFHADLIAPWMECIDVSTLGGSRWQLIARMAMNHVRCMGTADVPTIRRLLIQVGRDCSEAVDLDLCAFRRVAESLSAADVASAVASLKRKGAA